MNRDALLATLIGFGVGLLLTGIFLFGPGLVASLHLPKISFPTFAPKVAPTATPEVSAAFTVDSPLPDTIEPNQTVLVSGVSPTGSTVVIEGPSQEIVVTPNGDGKYAGNISLVEGRNDVVVTSYTDGKPTSKAVTVFYTSQKL